MNFCLHLQLDKTFLSQVTLHNKNVRFTGRTRAFRPWGVQSDLVLVAPLRDVAQQPDIKQRVRHFGNRRKRVFDDKASDT